VFKNSLRVDVSKTELSQHSRNKSCRGEINEK
jgi:hypothetical protein